MKTVLQQIRDDEERAKRILSMIQSPEFKDVLDVLKDLSGYVRVSCGDPAKVIEYSALENWRRVGWQECIKNAQNFDKFLSDAPVGAMDNERELFEPEDGDYMDLVDVLRRAKRAMAKATGVATQAGGKKQ